MLNRLVLGVILAVAVSAPALSSSGGETPTETEKSKGKEQKSALQTFVKLPRMVVEFWGKDGLYHRLELELILECSVPVQQDKRISKLIRLALGSRPWEDFAKGNAASLVKAVALSAARQDPQGMRIDDVLVSRLMVF